MAAERWCPRLCRDYTACARGHALDLAASCLLYLSASVMAGRVWRFPFDDEIYTFRVIERFSALKLLTVYPGGSDVHPPLSYILFRVLQDFGFSEPGMRLCSLAMTASALALLHLLALTLMARRNGGTVAVPSRLIAVLLFGLSALAVSQGDAIRWYPLFAVLIALFVTLYVFAGNAAARLGAAVPLGLAASTNYLAILVILPLLLYRYGLQRKFYPGFDGIFWLVAALFAASSFYSAYSLAFHHLAVAENQVAGSIVQAALTDLLGFFGGATLGLSQAWIVVPAIAIAAVAMAACVERREPASPAHLLLLMLAAGALMALVGFAKPRSFLYLTPILAAVVTLFLDRQARQRGAGLTMLMAALLVASSVAAIANINGGSHPFKRAAAIPYRSIVDFIDANANGNALIVSTDPVMRWTLRRQDNRCVATMVSAADCLAAGRRYESVFVIAGHSVKSANAAVMTRFGGMVETVTAGRHKVATLQAGVDDDAELKSRLTGVALDRAILTIELYR